MRRRRSTLCLGDDAADAGGPAGLLPSSTSSSSVSGPSTGKKSLSEILPQDSFAGGVPKRQKTDAIHAADAVPVDPPGALAPFHFLDHQPPDVVLYTP